MHGGCTPDIKRAAKLQALEFARGMLGAELDVHPLDGALLAVRLAAGSVAYWRAQLAETDEPTLTMREGFRMAVNDLSRMSKAAIDAGVAERQVRFAERTAERIALAAEEALTQLLVCPAERARFVHVFAENLRRMEQAPIEGTATVTSGGRR